MCAPLHTKAEDAYLDFTGIARSYPCFVYHSLLMSPLLLFLQFRLSADVFFLGTVGFALWVGNSLIYSPAQLAFVT